MKAFFSKPLVLLISGAVVGILLAFAYSRFLTPLKTLAAKLPSAQPPTA